MACGVNVGVRLLIAQLPLDLVALEGWRGGIVGCGLARISPVRKIGSVSLEFQDGQEASPLSTLTDPQLREIGNQHAKFSLCPRRTT